MPIIFEKTARSSAWVKLVHLVVSLIVCGALGAAGWYIDDMFARIVIGLMLLIGIAITVSTFREMMIYSRSNGKWRVEIHDRHLIWDSPVQKLFQSFRIRLADINYLHFAQYVSGGTKSKTTERNFLIHLNDGTSMQIPSQNGGVWVNDVFEALEQAGIRYEREHLSKSQFRTQYRQYDIVPMTAWAR